MITIKTQEVESSLIADEMKELCLSILTAVYYMPPWGLGVRKKTHSSSAVLRHPLSWVLCLLCICVWMCMFVCTHTPCVW